MRRPYRLQRKIVTFVPHHAAEHVAAAMAREGAGVIGNYDHCSFRLAGKGTFRGNDASHPTVGKPGRLEEAEETRLEMVFPAPRLHGWCMPSVRRILTTKSPTTFTGPRTSVRSMVPVLSESCLGL